MCRGKVMGVATVVFEYQTGVFHDLIKKILDIGLPLKFVCVVFSYGVLKHM